MGDPNQRTWLLFFTSSLDSLNHAGLLEELPSISPLGHNKDKEAAHSNAIPGGGFKYFCHFHPNPWENGIQFDLRSHFFKYWWHSKQTTVPRIVPNQRGILWRRRWWVAVLSIPPTVTLPSPSWRPLSTMKIDEMCRDTGIPGYLFLVCVLFRAFFFKIVFYFLKDTLKYTWTNHAG